MLLTSEERIRRRLLRPKLGASQVALVVKNLPANARDIEMQVPSLGQENPLEEVMTNNSSILAWRTPWTEESDRLCL